MEMEGLPFLLGFGLGFISSFFGLFCRNEICGLPFILDVLESISSFLWFSLLELDFKEISEAGFDEVW